MEESEKRRERLKAMRMEAAHAEASSNVETSTMPSCLSNPLSETSSSSTVQGDFCTTPRFDFYTDPMAAFSANKKECKGPMPRPSPSYPGPRNSDRNQPVHQMQSQFSFDQSIYQQRPHRSFTAHRSPRITSPSPMHQGHSDDWNGPHATANYYNFASDGSLRGMLGTPPMHPGTYPRIWNPSNTSGYGNLPSPGFSPADRPNFNYGRGSPQMFGSNQILHSGPEGSPGFSSGRGWSRGNSGSIIPGRGRSGGRGQGFHGRSSASNRTQGVECFFDESMLEDPWQNLKPILWKRQEAGMHSLSTPGSSNSWLPKSIGLKKAKVSEDSSNKFNSQQSLAEYLAASFNKAVEDTQNA